MPEGGVVLVRRLSGGGGLVVSVPADDGLRDVDALVQLRVHIVMLHVEIGQTEVHVSLQGAICAVEGPVDDFWNEFTCQSNDESIGDDGDFAKSLHDIEPDSNVLNLLSNWPPGQKIDNYYIR